MTKSAIYDPTSSESQLGDNFRDLVIDELNKRGFHFESTAPLVKAAKSGDGSLGDAVDQTINIYVETKASFMDHPKTVCIKPIYSANFVGNNRFYAVSTGDGKMYDPKVKFFRADAVKKQLENTAHIEHFRVRGSGSSAWQVFNHETIIPFAIGFDDFAQKLAAELQKNS